MVAAELPFFCHWLHEETNLQELGLHECVDQDIAEKFDVVLRQRVTRPKSFYMSSWRQ